MSWKIDEGSPVLPGQCSCTQLQWLLCVTGIELVDHPPYSPDLAPTIFCSPTWEGSSIGPMPFEEDISAVEDFFEDQDESFCTTGIQVEVCGPLGRLC